jgi:4-amino-4-deoxy-L-arabinose transferase-like glycosyltransferase
MPDGGRIRAALAPFSLIVAGITLVGLALRLPLLGDSLTRDELSTYAVVAGHDLDAVIDLVRSNFEGTPPLFFVLAWMTKGIGSTPHGLGLTSMFAGVAAIPLVYLLGLRTVGRPAGMVAAALVALSPFLIFFSTEARAYSLLMALVLLSTLCLLEALRDGRLRWWIAYGGCSVLAMYTHYTGVFVLVGQLAWALWAHREAWRGLAAANFGAALAYVPWVPGYLDDRNGPAAFIIEALRPFRFSTVKEEVYHWFLSPLPASDVPGKAALWSILAGLAVGAVGLVDRRVASRRGRAQARAVEPPEAADTAARPHLRCASARPPAGLVLVIVLALATPVGAALYSLHWPSIHLSRNLIASWPGLALCVGALLTAGSRWLAVPAVGLVVAGFAVGAARSLYSDNRAPDYDAAAAFIEAAGPAGAPVVQMPFFTETAGPFTALEAAFGVSASSASREHPLSVFDRNPLAQRVAQLESAVPVDLLTPPSPTPPDEIARQARRRAAGDNLFLVVASDAPLGDSYPDLSPTGQFLRTLYAPGGLVPVAGRSFDGVWPLTVWVLRPPNG